MRSTEYEDAISELHGVRVFRRSLAVVYVIAIGAIAVGAILIAAASKTDGIGRWILIGIGLAVFAVSATVYFLRDRFRFVVVSISDTELAAPLSLKRPLHWDEIFAARREMSGGPEARIDGIILNVRDPADASTEHYLRVAKNRFPDEPDALVIEIGDLAEADRAAAITEVVSRVNSKERK